MIEAILKAVAAKKRLLILTHNNPDPDAMGAAFALKVLLNIKLKKKCTIAYMGMIGRLENREFVRQCKIDMVPSFGLNFKRFDYIILVDSQPQAGNVYIPSGYQVDLVVDHHLVKKALPKRKDFIADIRPTYGSTCSILSEYYKLLEIVPDANVATALCTGITTDAIGSGRDSGKVDQEMLGFIYPYVSLRKLAKIKSPELPRYHFKTLRRAIENAVIIDELLYCDLGDVRNSDLIAESADYLLRMREIKCVFVVGVLDKVAMFSLRYKSTRKSVGRIAMRMVKGIGYGGGHIKSAGGQVPLGNREYEDVVNVLKTRLVKYLGIKTIEEKAV